MNSPEKAPLPYEVRQAIPVLRKALARDPHRIAAALLKDMPREAAVAVMLQMRDHLAQLTDIARAFSELGAALARSAKEKTDADAA